MCGISAIIGLEPAAVFQDIRNMSDRVAHRGPDDDGIVLFRRTGNNSDILEFQRNRAKYSESMEKAEVQVALAHRRLSILDLSDAGRQPMCTPERRFWITYNGEVYNYLELRETLKNRGYLFYTGTDTEVILNAYKEWGVSCLNRFNGMFAFVIFDTHNENFFLARDRFGIKPLYYWYCPKGFLAIASEIKQFSVLPGWNAKMNPQRVYDHLNWSLTDHTDETLFQDVYQLRGGEYALFRPDDINDRKLPVNTWYHLRPRIFDGSFSEAAEHFRKIFFDAVRLRLRSDVPVGSCLSGGLDSSSIVCTINKILGESDSQKLQKTFSALADVKHFDESEFIEAVVLQTKTEAYHVYPSLDYLFEVAEKLTWYQDEPVGSTNIFAQWSVFKLSSENGVKVMLDGQGADELLAGYHAFFASRFLTLLKSMKLLQMIKEMIHTKRNHQYSIFFSFKRLMNLILPEVLRQPLKKMYRAPSADDSWLNFKKIGAEKVDPFAIRGLKSATVNSLSLAQLISINLPMLLHWEDRDSMAHSVESRVPFLDYRLVEFVSGLPEEYKIYNGLTKRILRKGMEGILPEKVRNRMDKLGFDTPEEVWMKKTSPERFRRELDNAVVLSQGIINERTIKKHFESVIQSKIPFNHLIWRIISFGHWIKKFEVGLP